jgi:hypothetical protein
MDECIFCTCTFCISGIFDIACVMEKNRDKAEFKILKGYPGFLSSLVPPVYYLCKGINDLDRMFKVVISASSLVAV